MTYTGTLLKELYGIVEGYLQRNARICAICGQRYQDHSIAGDYCPDLATEGAIYLSTSFAERKVTAAKSAKASAA